MLVSLGYMYIHPIRVNKLASDLYNSTLPTSDCLGYFDNVLQVIAAKNILAIKLKPIANLAILALKTSNKDQIQQKHAHILHISREFSYSIYEFVEAP